jgi:coproporphyrinogen III oxidase-like Fe-S oxidoreductase
VSVPEVTSALLAKYDVPGPRYTSYPAVPDWRGAFDHEAWGGHLAVLGTSEAPLALYVHLPFCASRCLYCGCNATVTTRAEVVDRYLTRLQDTFGIDARTECSVEADPRLVTWEQRRTIETALSMTPDRVACFGYAHVPWMKPQQKRIDESALPRAGDRFALFREAVRRFNDHGYRR